MLFERDRLLMENVLNRNSNFVRNLYSISNEEKTANHIRVQALLQNVIRTAPKVCIKSSKSQLHLKISFSQNLLSKVTNLF